MSSPSPAHDQDPVLEPVLDPDLDSQPLVNLIRIYLGARSTPRALPRSLRNAIHKADRDTLLAVLEQTLRSKTTPNPQERQLRSLLAEMQQSHEQLTQQLQKLTQPPHSVARLLRFDTTTRRALVATAPNARTEVSVHEDIDPEELVAGRDIVLTAERNCVLRVVKPAESTAGQLGGGRIARFGAFVGAEESAAQLRAAYVQDARGETLVSVPHELADRIEATLAGGGASPRLCIDELGYAFAMCDGDGDDPRAAASRFGIDLQPITEAEVIGLDRQRQRIQRTVARIRERGGFVLSEGATGSGKTHLARYALHLMQQTAETVVLGLQSTPDHRYVGQEESDVTALFACARATVASGKNVLIFIDELDKYFFRSRHGQSVHVNSTRATWLQQIGMAAELQGIFVYATTNKAAQLPDELLNRVTQPLSFGGVDRAQAKALLIHYLSQHEGGARELESTAEAVVGLTHDRVPEHAIATVTLRDQTERVLHASDLRQVSARFFHEVALRLGDAALAGAPLTTLAATTIAADHLEEVTCSLGLSAENIAERTFVEFAPRNPAELVRLLAPTAANTADATFGWDLTEVRDDSES